MKTRVKILIFVNRFARENGYAPTIREIADNVGLSSVSTVHTHLLSLEKDGLILRDNGRIKLFENYESTTVLERDSNGPTRILWNNQIFTRDE
ncbi:winged helix-turn-helix transcriptional regulator [Paenibacillus pabuli]|uniref:LexA family protein n=1 Tax=Paenibacillus pabuli TaxID=1472 RepID=UPI003241CFCD